MEIPFSTVILSRQIPNSIPDMPPGWWHRFKDSGWLVGRVKSGAVNLVAWEICHQGQRDILWSD